MLKREIKRLFIMQIALGFLLFNSCTSSLYEKGEKYKKVAIEIVGEIGYYQILNTAFDTLAMRRENNIFGSNDTTYNISILDSLLCINSTGDRMIGCVMQICSGKNRGASSDGLTFFFGEKINGAWYMYTGPYVVIPHSMVEGHPRNQPLSYKQLHEIALKEVYSGYLNSAGSINEDWFKNYFENVGVCAECKTREDFQKNIVAGSAAIWSTRDTTQPIKHLNKTTAPLP